MRTVIKTPWPTIKPYAQVLLVWVAFSLMVTVSYFFAGNIVLKHLMYETLAALDSSQSKIEADLLEPQTLMSSISHTIRSMILAGEDPELIRRHMTSISDNVIKDEKRKLALNGLYGVFDIFGGAYFNDGGWTPPEDYVPQDRPWYKAAAEAKGKVTFSPLYRDMRTNSLVLSCTCSILDEEGRQLGVLCMDVPFDKIAEYIVPTRLAEDGYSLLLSKNLEVIAHPQKTQLGKPLREWNSGLVELADDLMMNKDVSGRRVINYRNQECIVFFRRLKNDWYLGIVTPYGKYYKDVNNMRVGLILLGLTLAASLSIIFLRIAAAKAKSDEKTQQKSNFLARMSHEIRTPMNAILGIAEIQLQNETLSQNVREAFAKINNSGDLLLGIINDILDLSKIEAGKLELMPSKYDVPSLIYDTAQLNMLRFESKPIQFHLVVDEAVPLELIGDELRIKQILNNLLSNAFKYTERGDVSLFVNAEYVLRGSAALVTLVFRVSDTGQGMTAEQVRKLGDEYSRFNIDVNRTTEGTGLGMSITLNLIQMMNGKFSVESKPGKGTTVTVRLPQRNIGTQIFSTIGKELAESLGQSRVSRASQMQKSQITRELMPYGKVLIVDDVESNLFVAKGLMAPYELSIDTAMSGFEAIEKIKNGKVYDIVFMDHMMPKMDGMETVKIMRSMGYKNPIVALTANALAGQAELFLENGFDGFVPKPIDIRQLNTLLNRMIRDKQPPGVIEAVLREKEKSKAKKESSGGESDESVNSQLAQIFVRDAEKALAALEPLSGEKTFTGDDIQTYIINAHSMKSALANIGETELSGIALKLENAGRVQNTAMVTEETPAFLNALRELIKKIKSREDEGKDTEKDSDEACAHLKEKLKDIQAACFKYDKKTAKEVLTGLREKTWSRPVNELLNTIAERLLHSEFEEAADIAGNYGKNSAN